MNRKGLRTAGSLDQQAVSFRLVGPLWGKKSAEGKKNRVNRPHKENLYPMDNSGMEGKKSKGGFGSSRVDADLHNSPWGIKIRDLPLM